MGKLIGPFNPVLWSPNISASFLGLQRNEEAHTSLSERLRQVVILSVGSVWNAPYELYAHQAVARKAGLSEKTIESLTAGEACEELSKEEQLGQQFTLQLTANHRVDDELFAAALSAFGEKGLVDMITLAGCYMLVCSLLNAFEIPAPTSSHNKEERS
jgi:4-carboxymuconolactone decarboxylase